MTSFLSQYGLFLLQVLTIVAGVVGVIWFAVKIILSGKESEDESYLKIRHLNDFYDNLTRQVKSSTMNNAQWKQFLKSEKKKQKDREKRDKDKEKQKKRVFVLDFKGSIEADEVKQLREEITAILLTANDNDEVVLRLESYGGTISGYGLAAAQLQRLKERNIHLTVAIDEAAASGGYLMACVADRIVAAPFAFIGSIGIISEVPNVHRLLKRLDVDYEVMTAGEYKSTISHFAEITPKSKKKHLEELQNLHNLFKAHIQKYRPQVDIEKVATGEVWTATEAKTLGLIDDISTSDDVLLSKREDAEILKLNYTTSVPWQEKIALPFSHVIESGIKTILNRLQKMRWQ
jgi:serine protease SohB